MKFFSKLRTIIQLFISKTSCNPSENIISKECPLGKAIMDKKVGDRVEVFVSNEVRYFVEIRYIVKGEDDESLPITKY